MQRYRLLLVMTLASLAHSVASAGDLPDPAKLALIIDARLAVGWDKANVLPAPVADDATFLRRASLDLIGRIPTVAETLSFLADNSPDKRKLLVNRLIDSGGHARHMAGYLRKTWVPQTNAEFARLAEDFESWVAARVQHNSPYDQIVRNC